jgi:hypothetical protein
MPKASPMVTGSQPDVAQDNAHRGRCILQNDTGQYRTWALRLPNCGVQGPNFWPHHELIFDGAPSSSETHPNPEDLALRASAERAPKVPPMGYSTGTKIECRIFPSTCCDKGPLPVVSSTKITPPMPITRLSPSLAVIFTPASRWMMYCRGARCQSMSCSAYPA